MCHAFGFDGARLWYPKRAEHPAEETLGQSLTLSSPSDILGGVSPSLVGQKVLIRTIVIASPDGLLPPQLHLVVRGLLLLEHRGLREPTGCTMACSALEMLVGREAVLLDGGPSEYPHNMPHHPAHDPLVTRIRRKPFSHFSVAPLVLASYLGPPCGSSCRARCTAFTSARIAGSSIGEDQFSLEPSHAQAANPNLRGVRRWAVGVDHGCFN